MIPHQQTMRLFVAIELSPGAKLRLRKLQQQLSPQCPDVRWTHEEQLHLTLRFIGDAPVGDVEAIARVIGDCAASADPFDMTVEGAGCFPSDGRVRIVWAGVHEEVEAEKNADISSRKTTAPMERRSAWSMI